MTKAKESKSVKREYLKKIINGDKHIYVDVSNISKELNGAIERLYKNRKKIKLSYSKEYKDMTSLNKNYVLITDDPLSFKKFNVCGGKAIFLGRYRYESGCHCLEIPLGEDQTYYEKKIKSFIH